MVVQGQRCVLLTPADMPLCRHSWSLSLSAAGPTDSANGGSGGDHQHHITLAARRAPAIKSKAMGAKMRPTNITSFFSKSTPAAGLPQSGQAAVPPSSPAAPPSSEQTATPVTPPVTPPVVPPPSPAGTSPQPSTPLPWEGAAAPPVPPPVTPPVTPPVASPLVPPPTPAAGSSPAGSPAAPQPSSSAPPRDSPAAPPVAPTMAPSVAAPISASGVCEQLAASAQVTAPRCMAPLTHTHATRSPHGTPLGTLGGHA